MKFGLKTKYDIKDLDFEPIRKFRFVSKTDLAKSKLLTGKQIFKLNNNDCNFIEVIDSAPYLHWKEVDIFNSKIEDALIPLTSKYLTDFKYKRLSGNLFCSLDERTYCILDNKSIVCIFHLFSLSDIKIISFIEDNQGYQLKVSSTGTTNIIFVQKSTLSMSINSI